MFETMVDFVLVEHLYGATFDPPIAPMGYSRILTKERRPFKTRDGFLTVLPYTDKNWRDFFRIVGREDLQGHPDFGSLPARVKNADKVYALIAEMVADRSSAELQRELEAAQIPVMPVLAIEDLIDDAQLACSCSIWGSV
jgi:crotonobetainyl-CoA:carnitine CoA-transferase CaiB-like acyl-CoA transferase